MREPLIKIKSRCVKTPAFFMLNYQSNDSHLLLNNIEFSLSVSVSVSV